MATSWEETLYVNAESEMRRACQFILFDCLLSTINITIIPLLNLHSIRFNSPPPMAQKLE